MSNPGYTVETMNLRIVPAVAALAVLAGCESGVQCFSGGCENVPGGPVGGGGGLITIDENNALPALREAWFAATVTAAIPAFVVATGIGDTSGGVAGGGPIVSKLGSSGRVYVDPFGPTTYNCPVSGQFTVSGDVTDPNTVTAGDVINYDSSACNSGTGYTVDGAHDLLVSAVNGDPSSGQYEQTQTLDFTDFRATSSSLVTTLNGDHTSTIDTSDPNLVTSLFSGGSLSVNEEQITVSISNYSGLETIGTASPFSYTLDGVGRANSSLITGSFDYSIGETILQQGGQWPSDGILNIYGLNNGTARVVVFDQLEVTVQVDANGSDNYEFSVRMTWEEFLGL